MNYSKYEYIITANVASLNATEKTRTNAMLTASQIMAENDEVEWVKIERRIK